MKLRISLTQAVAVAAIVTATLPLLPINAAAQIAVSSNDGKLVLSNGTVSVPANPGDDTVTIIDLGVSPPKVIAEFKAPSSVVGPPQNVAVAPDESFALVAATMKLDPADPKKQVPDSRLSGFGRQLPGRDRLNIHYLRQNADCGRQDRFRRSESRAGRNIFHPRWEDCPGHARRRPPHFHFVG